MLQVSYTFRGIPISESSSLIDLIAVAGSVYGRLNVSAERFPNSPRNLLQIGPYAMPV